VLGQGRIGIERGMDAEKGCGEVLNFGIVVAGAGVVVDGDAEQD
jgi:hypothetical protein